MARFPDGKALTLTAMADPGIRWAGVDLHLEEGQRRMVILALAMLSLERPGFRDTLEEIAGKMDNRLADGRPQMFTELRELHAKGPRKED